MDLLIKKLSNDAKLPERFYNGDMGFDLFSCNRIVLKSNERYLIGTGIAIKLPNGFGAFLKDRSSYATKLGLHILAGVIDSTYINEIKVCVINLGNMPQTIEIGQKICQMVILPIPEITIKEVKELPENCDRGYAGFGSSGL